MDRTLMVIGNGLVIATFVLALAYAVTYHLTARWWTSEFGRSLMSLKIAIAAVTGLAVPRIIWGLDHVLFNVLRLVVFTAVPLALAWRLAVLIKTQRRG